MTRDKTTVETNVPLDSDDENLAILVATSDNPGRQKLGVSVTSVSCPEHVKTMFRVRNTDELRRMAQFLVELADKMEAAE